MTDTVVRAKFIRELGAVQDDMVRLGSMVDNALQHSIDALQYRDADIAHSVIAGDGQINDLRFQIEEDCTKLIAMQ
ncbi:MAG: PhoU domain-containing protein, partial [Chloroflexota bacterium]